MIPLRQMPLIVLDYPNPLPVLKPEVTVELAVMEVLPPVPSLPRAELVPA
jgi:hypothetical protein